ncbi:dachshund homolog 2 isoform X1 [Daktulosphaira vitifoliae]|uniref:dachshund homolog 2 isoform X1 n=1 Tax=Daktulosphaira vitifoliae TaxID=58002 RepID=UPI0021A9A8E0|nr:dachshund homolog 2 isoform X1 [Daktulosphaira vitifoliae]
MIMESTNAAAESAASGSDRSSNVSTSPPPQQQQQTPSSNNNGKSAGSSPKDERGSSPMMNVINPHHAIITPTRGMSPPTQTAPPVSSMSSLASRIPMGLFNSLVHHSSPLDLMAMAHHHQQQQQQQQQHPSLQPPPRSYNSPPPISSTDPTANECKLVEYRGQKVAAFMIAGDTMLCLPQAFELFLKHLVGGLHTVYTKLKRLDIVPLVCNVEQVRILRGMGAIQPGVNRCKLLSCKDFDTLYRDCTTARCMMSHKPTDSSSRPGRPPKRASSVGLSLAASASHLSHQMKKHRLENGDYVPGVYENGHMQDSPRMEKSPLLANGYNHPPTHLGHMQYMQQFNHHHHHPAAAHAIMNPAGLSHPALPRPDAQLLKSQGLSMEALASSGIWEKAYAGFMKQLERANDERVGDINRALSYDQKVRDMNSQNGSSEGHSPVLNLSKTGGDHSGPASDHSAGGHTNGDDEDDLDEDDDNISDGEEDDIKDHDLSDNPDVGGNSSAHGSITPPPQTLNFGSTGSVDMGLSYMTTESLLRKIQALLKAAADKIRDDDRALNFEKAELKMDVLREREVKGSLERQLVDAQKLRVIYQKRLRRERKARKRVQDQLEQELKRRAQLEEMIKAAGAPADALRILTENNNEKPRDRSEQSQSPNYPSGQGQRGSETSSEKQWNYSGLDLMSSSGAAAFWQNYSETFAQELDLERKARQQQSAQQNQQQSQHSDRDIKSPVPDSRAKFFNNSVLFSTAT